MRTAVIVPVGSKGGFVLKNAPPATDREAWMAEGIACYKLFLSGLLDVTDNVVKGTVVPPANVVRHDVDDPYLVVAADKGTATFSDIANGVSADNAWYLFKAGGSILIHSAPYTVADDGGKLYQGVDDLGVFPASRGCIRISPDDATWFTDWGPYDVPIVILPWDGGTGRAG